MANLKQGSSGPEVVKLQQALIAAGYDVGPSGADGKYGPDTKAAVVAYQNDHNLDPDGVAGTLTQGSLYGTSAPPPQPQPGGQLPPGPQPDAAANVNNNPYPVNSREWALYEAEHSEFFVYLQPFMEVPEIQQLVVDAVIQKWEPAKIQAQFQATKYYQTTLEQERTWTAMTETERQATIEKYALQTFNYAVEVFGLPHMQKDHPGGVNDPHFRRLGIEIASGKVTLEMALYTLRGTALQKPDSVIAINEKDRLLNLALKAKRPEELAEELFQEARNKYWNPITKDAARNFAKQISEGKLSFSEFSDIMRNQTKAMYPGISNLIDQGLNVKDYLSGHLNLASNVLELPESAIMLDDKIFGMLRQNAATGQLMSYSEFEAQLRQDPRWGKTTKAREGAADLGAYVAEMFGQVVL